MGSGSAEIPIDDDYSIDLGDTISYTSARTLATTTTMYRYENGRTYHAFRDGEYWQPNDEKQNNHEAIVFVSFPNPVNSERTCALTKAHSHHLCLLTLQDQLYLAPVAQPERVLDVGTGTGIWATGDAYSDMADKFPDAEVIGTDLSPVQPGMQPDNCRFEIDDCTAEWVAFPRAHFDLVHIRGLFGSIADWPALYQQAFAHLRPGGYLEQVEFSCECRSADGGGGSEGASLPAGSVFARWSANAQALGRATGKTFGIAEAMADLVRAAGFEDVVEKRFKWPVGPWSSDPRLKEIGRWNMLNWEEGMEGWVMALYTRVFGWSTEQVQDWLKEVRAALRDRKQHVYHEV